MVFFIGPDQGHKHGTRRHHTLPYKRKRSLVMRGRNGDVKDDSPARQRSIQASGEKTQVILK